MVRHAKKENTTLNEEKISPSKATRTDRDDRIGGQGFIKQLLYVQKLSRDRENITEIQNEHLKRKTTHEMKITLGGINGRLDTAEA